MKKIIASIISLAFILSIAVVPVLAVKPGNTGKPDADEPEVGAMVALSSGDSWSADLVAGQYMDVGDLTVEYDSENLCVTYMITEENWYLTETHLQVSTDYEGIPMNNGNPTPGQFETSDYLDLEDENQMIKYCYSASDWIGEDIYIAAHAVVCEKTVNIIGYENVQVGSENVLVGWTDPEETLYLSDSGVGTTDGQGSTFFEVELDNENYRANLTYIYTLNPENFDQVDAQACSADGKELYAIDKYSKHLGVYDLDLDTFEDLGPISGLPGGVVLAAFSPTDNLLYVASDDTDELYTIDVSDKSLTSKGTITLGEGTLGIQGADLVFDAEGTLYVWTNSIPPGLYEVDLGTMEAEFKGHPDPAEPYFTGLAIRAAGTGKLVGSTRLSDIWEVAKTDATTGKSFEPWFEGSPYDVGYGDMTVGIICGFVDNFTTD